MSNLVITTICSLLLIAYIFDITAAHTRIPSVILLLLVGWVTNQLALAFGLQIAQLESLLPVLGTTGLILIVLEGALELEFTRSNAKLIRRSMFSALAPLIGLSFLFAYTFYYYSGQPFRICLVNAIPLSIISSSIAIPSVKNLSKADKEFVIYESSFSDIFGVLFFNFAALNDTFDAQAFGHFGLELLIIILVSFLATLGLAFLLRKINHHIKFVPIIILIILIYSLSKIFHLPGLIFILLFGLFMGNLDKLENFKWIRKFHPEILKGEVHKFGEYVVEGAFLIRAIFFITFGYLIDAGELMNTDSLLWSIGIVISIFAFRFLQLKLYGLKTTPLLFIAPRGLITILLFLTIIPSQIAAPLNKAMITQVIVLTALILTIGLMVSKKERETI